MKNKYLLILFGIFILGFILRVYNLGSVPSGFHRDEAFLGYNSYSILKTGKDMSGNFFPLHLESFVYTPAGYSYVSLPLIQLFGLNEFSTRFASALFGALTIIITYFLTRELFSGGIIRNNTRNYTEAIALVSAGIIAFSAWHINLSRTASVITVVVFFISFGVVLFLQWLKRKKLWFLIASFISFGASPFFYVAPFSFLPLFIPLMVIMLYGVNIFSKQGKINVKIIFGMIFLYTLLIILPLIVTLFSDTLSLRARSLSIFEGMQTKLVLEESIREDGAINIPVIVTRIFHNKPMGFLTQFSDNYFKHISYEFFFTDRIFPERYRIPLTGILYFFDFPFLIIGILYLLIKKTVSGIFLMLWVLLSFVGSALTFDDIPNVQRTLLAFPALSIIIAFGIVKFFSFLRRFQIYVKLILTILIIFFAIYNFTFYLHQYYAHGKLYRPWYRHDGYKQLVVKLNKILPNYEKAVITDRESAPTIFFLFFSQYDPELFQQKPKDFKKQSIDRINFAKYEFSQEECPLRFDNKTLKITGERNVLYINSALCDVPKGAKLLEVIKRSDNSDAFKVLKVE